MARSVVDVVKSGTNQALDDFTKELWGEEAVEEIQPDLTADERQEQVQTMITFLSRTIGIRMTSELCGEPSIAEVKKWSSGASKPNGWQFRFLTYAYEIVSLLLMRTRDKKEVQYWWSNRNDYLAGFTPLNLFPSEPTGVRMAAMNYLMRS